MNSCVASVAGSRERWGLTLLSPASAWAEAQGWRHGTSRLFENHAKRRCAPWLLEHGTRHDGSRGTADDIQESDQALVRACLSGDGSSYAKLIERYQASVAGILWHFTRDRLVLEELVQETFVEAYLSLRRFRKGAPVFPWLKTIATRTGYRCWRRRRRELDHQAALIRWREAASLEAPRREPSDTADYVYRLLELLEPKYRLVLTLQYFEGCSITEIAQRTGWTPALAKVRAFRARKKLKALLEAEQSDHEKP